MIKKCMGGTSIKVGLVPMLILPPPVGIAVAELPLRTNGAAVAGVSVNGREAVTVVISLVCQ